jgi:hypothetical protein
MHSKDLVQAQKLDMDLNALPFPLHWHRFLSFPVSFFVFNLTKDPPSG